MEELTKNKTLLYGGVAVVAILAFMMLRGGGGGGGSFAAMQQSANQTSVALNGQVLSARTAQAQADATVKIAEAGAVQAIGQTFIQSLTAKQGAADALQGQLADISAGVQKAQIAAGANVQIADIQKDAQIKLAPILANENTALARIAASTQQNVASIQGQQYQQAAKAQETGGLMQLGGQLIQAAPNLINTIAGLFSGPGSAAASAATGAIGGSDLLSSAASDAGSLAADIFG